MSKPPSRRVTSLGLGQLAPTGDAEREQQVDRQQLDYGFGQFELALDETGNRAENESQHDRLQQVR
jgi:hypothetical protein